MKKTILTLMLSLIIQPVLAENYIIELDKKHYDKAVQVLDYTENNNGSNNNPNKSRTMSLNFEDLNLNFSDYTLLKSNGTIAEGVYTVNSRGTSSNGLAYRGVKTEEDKFFELEFDVKKLSGDSFPTMLTMGFNEDGNSVCIRWTRSSYGAYFFGSQELNSNLLLDGSSTSNWNKLKIIGDIENNKSQLYVNGNLKMEGTFPMKNANSIYFSLGGGYKNECVASDNGIHAEFDNVIATFK